MTTQDEGTCVVDGCSNPVGESEEYCSEECVVKGAEQRLQKLLGQIGGAKLVASQGKEEKEDEAEGGNQGEDAVEGEKSEDDGTVRRSKRKRKAAPKQDNDTSEPQEDPDTKLYCLCRQPYDGKRFMIGCDRCGDWFHEKCVGIGPKKAKTISKYYCPLCQAKFAREGKAKKKKVSAGDKDDEYMPDVETAGKENKGKRKREDHESSPEDSRSLASIKKEKKAAEPVAHKIRDLVKRQLEQALLVGNTEESRKSVAKTKGEEIETALWDHHHKNQNPKEVSQVYKTQYRRLVSNFRDAKNPQLRRRVLDGEISPSALSTMTSEDLASDEVKLQRKQLEEAGLAKSVVEEGQENPLTGVKHKLEVNTAVVPEDATDTGIVFTPRHVEPVTPGDGPEGTIASPPSTPSRRESVTSLGSAGDQLVKEAAAPKTKTVTASAPLTSPSRGATTPRTFFKKPASFPWSGSIKIEGLRPFRAKMRYIKGHEEVRLSNTLTAPGKIKLDALRKFLNEIQTRSRSRKIGYFAMEPETGEQRVPYQDACDNLAASFRAVVLIQTPKLEAYAIPPSELSLRLAGEDGRDGFIGAVVSRVA